ncbi:MAG: TetR/AcrR family transcriptional regulator [Gemmataceae bacterium]
MSKPRGNIAELRREQIIEAAIAIITEQGLQNLSLSEIETRAGMSRGQLTYYFPTKETILLAVFDRLLEGMCQEVSQVDEAHPAPWDGVSGWERIQLLLRCVVGQPPVRPEFHYLQYTFLSQIGHRADFRQRLATLYEEWRSRMAADLTDDWPRDARPRSANPRALATFIQAVLHGLTMQAAADPQSFDRQEMLDLCLDLLGSYLNQKRPPLLPERPPTNRRRPASSVAVTPSGTKGGKV